MKNKFINAMLCDKMMRSFRYDPELGEWICGSCGIDVPFLIFFDEAFHQLKWTHKQMAEWLHVSPRTVSKWRCGDSTPSLEKQMLVVDVIQAQINAEDDRLEVGTKVQAEFVSVNNLKIGTYDGTIKRFDEKKNVYYVNVPSIGTYSFKREQLTRLD